MLAAIAASIHYLALGIGLGSAFMRGRYIWALRGASAAERTPTLKALFMADNIWGVAALLWVLSGLARAFGGLEKGTAFYLSNPLFILKMGLFLLLFALETPPMITFIKWRIALSKKQSPLRAEDDRFLRRLYRLNSAEVVLLFLIPVIASMMARGIGL